MKLIIDSQYFPSIIFYKISYKISHLLFEQYENYQKMSFRNRCTVAGASGVRELSIPLAGGRDQKTLMRDVRMDAGRDWQGQHWKTIVACYSRSPWFDYYRHGLESLYRRRMEFLLDWNLSCLEWSLQVLGMTKSIALTDRYEASYDPEETMDWRGKIMPKSRGSRGEVARYRQVFGDRTGFLPDLSILDLLFCEGKEAIRYIQ
jgi:WbqC-like protein